MPCLVVLFLLCAVNVSAQYHPLFDRSKVHELRIGYSGSFVSDLSQAYRYKKEEKPYFRADLKIDSLYFSSVGLRQKGVFSNSFAWTDKKPLKVKLDEFNDDYEWRDIDKFNLANSFEDPSHLRDYLALWLMREMGVAAPRASFANVWVNDKNFGLHVIIEQVNKDFLQLHFDDNDGNLYEAHDASFRLDESGKPYISNKFYELKTNEKKNDRSHLKRFVDFVNHSDSQSFVDSIDYYVNTVSFLKGMAVELFIGQTDGVWFGKSHNFFWYQDISKGRFEWIPWDYNLSFGYGMHEPSEAFADNVQYLDFEHFLLLKRLLNQSTRHIKIFNDELERISELCFSPKFKKEVRRAHKLISPFVEQDSLKFYSFDQFQNSLHKKAGIKGDMNKPIPAIFPFLKARKKAIADFLKP